MNPRFNALRAAAAMPFRRSGRHAWYTARGKFRFDPVFYALISRGWLPDEGGLMDVGCGRGFLLALLAAARDHFLRGHWPPDWPRPPLNLVMRGFDAREESVAVARLALGSHALVDHMDARDAKLPSCAAITIVDVLLYLNAIDQVGLLEKAAAALAPGGVL